MLHRYLHQKWQSCSAARHQMLRDHPALKYEAVCAFAASRGAGDSLGSFLDPQEQLVAQRAEKEAPLLEQDRMYVESRLDGEAAARLLTRLVVHSVGEDS